MSPDEDYDASEISKQPLRTFTSVSARALAVDLATRDNPEKHLCPYLDLDSVPEVGQRPRQSKNEPAKASTKTGRETSESRIPRLLDQPEKSHKIAAGIHDSTRDRGNRPTASIKPKDTKSFAQALFDTKAMKNFHGAPGLHIRPSVPPSYARQESTSDELQSKIEAGLEQLEEYRGIKFKNTGDQDKHRAAVPETLTRRSIRSNADLRPIASGTKIDIFRSSKAATVNGQRPQTLSHFSKENLKALMWTAQLCQDQTSRGNRYNDLFGRTIAGEPLAENLPHLFPAGGSIQSFARQSMVHILSSPSALLSSFTYKTANHDKSGSYSCISIPFNDMVQAFHWLRKLEGYPQIILPSLSLAAEGLYASLPSSNHAKRTSEKHCLRVLRALVGPDIPKHSYKVKSERKAAHVASIIFAALVATIPPCSIKVWDLVQLCHTNGVMVPDKESDPSTIRSLQHVLDAFEDGTALDLLAKLVKALSTRTSVGELMNRLGGQDDLGGPVAQEKDVVNQLLDGLYEAETDPFAYVSTSETSNGRTMTWKYDSPLPGKPREYCPSYINMIVEWLKVLVIKDWDGKPEIDKFSATGGALEVLRVFCM
ncbi:MAG: hypothetical protein Q9166_000094 [cf. Caloplaca sp. 2 TL-2023]